MNHDLNNQTSSQKPRKNSKGVPFFFLIVLLSVLSVYVLRNESLGQKDSFQMDYSEFLSLVESPSVQWHSVEFVERNIRGTFSVKEQVDDTTREYLVSKYHAYLVPQRRISDKEFFVWTYSPSDIDSSVVQQFKRQGIPFKASPETKNYLQELLLQILPFLIIIGLLWFFLFRQIQTTGNRALSFGKNRAKLFSISRVKITFDDVAGVEEAKEELKETVEFLKVPEKFKQLGAKIPKGVLLIGPPGTGKTLLAKSVAGEANCPFFSISGSDFVEMFVGIGASRVRDLFEQSRRSAPCIIFIDELDAVGRVRGAGYGGGHDEREQTLNQMLVEMDGFDSSTTVIVIAATNRPDVLDPALLRSGRFDRRVVVGVPDVKGREAILKIHTAKLPLSQSVDLSLIARGTPGLSGADLSNLVNEAAIIAAKLGKRKIQMEDLEHAKDKVLMGPERKSLALTDEEKLNTAYHEAGHALLSFMLPKVNPLYKVSIIPRGNALGVTQMLPQEERLTLTKEHLLEEMMVLFGGRIAEEYRFENKGITNGSSNDIERATKIARSMVCEWGMSDILGPIAYGQGEKPIFIGKEIAQHKDYSEDTANKIDCEIKKIVNFTFNKAKQLILENSHKLEKIVEELLNKEVLDRHEIQLIIVH